MPRKTHDDDCCEKCGERLELGSWPWCESRTNPRGHHTARSTRAQRFAPVVYFVNATGDTRMAGRDTDATPRGYERRELRTLPEYDRFCRREERRLMTAREAIDQREQAVYDHVKRTKRADVDARLSGKLNDEQRQHLRDVREYVDNKRGERYQAQVYAECFEQNASNREAYRRDGPHWAPRK